MAVACLKLDPVKTRVPTESEKHPNRPVVCFWSGCVVFAPSASGITDMLVYVPHDSDQSPAHEKL